jgi:SAM-dependent methyltransferase
LIIETDSIIDALHPSREEALAAWAQRVRENRLQAERVREATERPDFYAPTAAMFKSDPFRKGDVSLDNLHSLVKPGETWLDIGSGAGRNALPLALLAGEVIAVDPSRAMLSGLRQGMQESGIQNIRIIEGRWPLHKPLPSDVALISHVGYDIENIGPFLEAMEASARRLCVALFFDGPPAAPAARFWPAVHGEERVALPSLREFLVLQAARGCLCEVKLIETRPQSYGDRDSLLAFLRQQLFIEPGGKKDVLLQRLMAESVQEESGRIFLKRKPGLLGMVSWRPDVIFT